MTAMASTAAEAAEDVPSGTHDLEKLLESLSLEHPLEASREALRRAYQTLRQLRNLILESSSSLEESLKDGFRRNRGFERLLQILRNITALPKDSNALLVDTLEACLSLLSEVFWQSPRNLEYFRTRHGTAGWTSVEQAVLCCFCPPSETDSVSLETARGFSLLLALALHDDSLTSVFVDQDHQALRSRESVLDDIPQNAMLVLPALASILVKASVSSLEIPWPNTHDNAQNHTPEAERLSEQSQLIANVFAATSKLVREHEYNILQLHVTGLLTTLLTFMRRNAGIASKLPETIQLSCDLLQLGPNDLDDANSLLTSAAISPSVSKLLLDGLRSSGHPPKFVFDLSQRGNASLEFQELPGPFPPPTPSNGYTLMLWMSVQQFDKTCHTTIFGASDASQTCFTLVYLERSSNNLVLQTSISSGKPSVRFKTVTFREKRLYHVAIVHQRPRKDGHGVAALFVDGLLREKVKCPFPSAPPLVSTGGLRPTKTPARVQAFFGTPHALSPHPEGSLSSKWFLSSGHLFGNAVPEELIFVYEKLGPLYHGNFQDSLGSFQTYNASAVLNLRNELFHGGRDELSVISAAVRSQAGLLNPESNLLISISPNFAKEDLIADGPHRTRNLFLPSTSTTTVPNGAVPFLARSPSKNNNALMMGGAILFKPLPLTECIWRLSGLVPSVSRLVAQALTGADLVHAVTVYVETFKESWRNSEAMERGNGYGLLSWLLQRKLSPSLSDTRKDSPAVVPLLDAAESIDWLPLRLMKLLIHSTTLNFQDKTSAIIANPLAYRLIIIDNQVWQQCSVDTQKYFFEQLTVFILESQNKTFNLKRLIRMRK